MNLSTSIQNKWEQSLENFFQRGSYKNHDEALKDVIKLLEDNQKRKEKKNEEDNFLKVIYEYAFLSTQEKRNENYQKIISSKPYKNMNDDEIMFLVNNEIKESRKEKK